MTYVPLDDRGWRLTMGLRPLEEAEWLEADERRDAELALKAALLDGERDRVLALRPESDEPSEEIYALVRENLTRFHPGLATFVDGDEHPLVRAARVVQEDLCVMARSDQWRLVGAVVCFPSRWRLADKIGTTLDEIHGPVPLYDERLGSPTRSVFDRLTPQRSFWRLNWTVLDSAELFQPDPARSAGATPIEEWSFRVERQTIRRLARSGAVLFTIRTYVSALEEVLARPGAAHQLLSAIDTAPESTRAYKGWDGVAERLRRRLGAPGD